MESYNNILCFNDELEGDFKSKYYKYKSTMNYGEFW